MQTTLAESFRNTPEGEVAEGILRSCVHCGFCLATCPTYQLLGNELDSPRGRIYLIKQVLEGATPTAKTQLHLDRCLTCRNCETTCPSGVEYGKLLDIGRHLVEEKVGRGVRDTATRAALKTGLGTHTLFNGALKLGQSVRGLMPGFLKSRIPAAEAAGDWPRPVHARRMLVLQGCVQPGIKPNIKCRHRTRARPYRHLADRSKRSRLLRRAGAPPQRHRGRPRRRAPQHRRLAAAPRRRGGGDRDDRLGLRRDGEGLRLAAAQ